MAKILEEMQCSSGNSILHKCDTCGKKVKKSKTHFLRSEKHFCSLECRDDLFSGNNSPQWRGGITVKDNYILIHKSKVEEKYQPMADQRGYIKQHRYVLAKKLGRNLSENEIVHHINKNTKDNAIGNLKLMTRSEHTKYHLKERGNEYSKGVNNGRAKLTEQEVKRIKKLFTSSNLTQKEIGEMFDVSNTTISAIKVGDNWGHLSL